MQRDYFGIAILGSLVFHVLFFTAFHYTNLNAKPIQVTVDTPPIAISLYEEQKKEESPKPKPKKVEKKQKAPQKKQQEPMPKTVSSEPIKTAQTLPLQQASSEEPSTPKLTPQVTTRSQNGDEVKKYLLQIRKTLQDNLEYPYFVRKAGIEGITTVHFCIKADGGMPRQSLRIIKSSGSTALDKQALETVQLSAPFAPPPKGEIEVSIPVSFLLNG